MWFEIYVFLIAYSALFLAGYCNNVKVSVLNSFTLFGFILIGLFTYYINYSRDIVSDSIEYAKYFNQVYQLSLTELAFSEHRFMFGFRIWTWINTLFTSNVRVYFALTSLLMYFLCFFAFQRQLGLKYAFLCSIVTSMFPWFSLYSSSGLRQGLCMAFFLISISYYLDNKNKLFVIFYILSFLFHKTIVIFFPVFIILRFFSFKKSLVVYSASLIVGVMGGGSILSTTQVLLTSDFSNYFLNSTSEYKTGFRVDFTLISVFPVFIYLILKKMLKFYNSKIDNLMTFYVLASSYINIMNFIPFYDRIAAYSWILIPFLIVYMIKIADSNVVRFSLITTLFLINILAFRFYNWNWYFLLSSPV